MANKSELLQETFGQIIAEGLMEGYSRGVEVFTESLEEDLAKAEVFEEGVTLEDVVDHLMTEAGYEVEEDAEVTEE
jgi:hypothetical protein